VGGGTQGRFLFGQDRQAALCRGCPLPGLAREAEAVSKSAESASTRRSRLPVPLGQGENTVGAGLLAGLGIQALLERLLPGRDGVTFAFQALFSLSPRRRSSSSCRLSSEERRACSWA